MQIFYTNRPLYVKIFQISLHNKLGLYKSELNLYTFKSLEAKEVQNYISTLKKIHIEADLQATKTNN